MTKKSEVYSIVPTYESTKTPYVVEKEEVKVVREEVARFATVEDAIAYIKSKEETR